MQLFENIILKLKKELLLELKKEILKIKSQVGD